MDNEIIEVAPPVYPAHAYGVTADGEKVSLKNACFHCSVSVYWCKCPVPKPMTRKGYQDVTIVC